ncbi:thrombospondin type 3 repeat-containing protein, partial [Patescibacteria group bacterium]|nr:thrombospondin type 3 repeat-containing protein [Patescibacteria group bacterium]
TTPYGKGTVDSDGDGITDVSDNCPEVANPNQDRVC